MSCSKQYQIILYVGLCSSTSASVEIFGFVLENVERNLFSYIADPKRHVWK